MSPQNAEIEHLRRAASPGSNLTNGHVNGKAMESVFKEERLPGYDVIGNIHSGRVTPSDKQDRSKTPELSNRGRSPTPTVPNQMGSTVELGLDSAADTGYASNREALTTRGASPADGSHVVKAQNSQPVHTHNNSSVVVSPDVVRTMRQEISSLRKRENWMKASLAKAYQEGFLPSQDDSGGLDDLDAEAMENTASLVRLKHAQAKLQASANIMSASLHIDIYIRIGYYGSENGSVI